MPSLDGRYRLVFNGEIHNYLELKSELQRLGETFETESDSEVLLAAYRCWGTDCFSRFNGMWAVAIWDSLRRELLLSRDRFGIKPLFYSVTRARFVFASEVKAILVNFPEEAVPCESEVFSFLVGGNPDGDSKTFFRNVHSLPPATFAVVTPSGMAQPVPYWQIDPGRRASGSDGAEKLRFLLEDSVRLRMRSDVPVGVCLSGGLDSSSVTRLAIQDGNEPLHCFSLRYDDFPKIDESDFVRLVADDPARYRVHWVTPRQEDFLVSLDQIVWHHDAPVPLRGRTAFWALMAEARNWVKVVLTGEGGDELLGGYTRFIMPWLLDRSKQHSWLNWLNPNEVRDFRNLLGIGQSLPWMFLHLLRPIVRRARLHARHGQAGLVDPDFAPDQREVAAHKFQHTWLRPDVDRPFESHLNNALWIDFRHSGLPELLHQQDALGMAFSLECRPPLLDHRLVEFCFSLDFDRKISGGWSKRILRQAMRRDLPPAVIQRRDKKGMPTPFTAFLTNPRTLGEIGTMLLTGEAVTSGIISRAAVRRLLERFESRLLPVTAELLNALWRCLSLELWLRRFIAHNGSIWASSSSGIPSSQQMSHR